MYTHTPGVAGRNVSKQSFDPVYTSEQEHLVQNHGQVDLRSEVKVESEEKETICRESLKEICPSCINIVLNVQIHTYIVLKCILCSCECFMYVTIYVRTYACISTYIYMSQKPA